MLEKFKLSDSEYRFASIVWEHEPIASGELVHLCEAQLGWKKSTTYTVLKKLCQCGIMANERATVTALVAQEKVQKFTSEQVVNHTFGGSLTEFLAAFISDKKLSEDEVTELKELIDKHKEV